MAEGVFVRDLAPQEGQKFLLKRPGIGDCSDVPPVPRGRDA
jgi:hypothetical protein